jgi:hypothetical protein
VTIEISPALSGVAAVLAGALITAVVMLRLAARDVEKLVPKSEELERQQLTQKSEIAWCKEAIGEQGRPGSLRWAQWEHENALRKWIPRVVTLEKRAEKHSTRIEQTRDTVDSLEITGRSEAIVIPTEVPRPRKQLRPAPPREPDEDDNENETRSDE